MLLQGQYQILVEIGQTDQVAVGIDVAQVFDAHAETAIRVVETWLDTDDVARLEFVFGEMTDARSLVDVQPDAMPQAVNVADSRRRVAARGRVSLALEVVLHRFL